MKHKHLELDRRLPLSPAAQLRNVIDALCDEELEAEISAEDQQAAPTKYPHYETEEPGSKKAELLQFARDYARKLEIERGEGIQSGTPTNDSSADSVADDVETAKSSDAPKAH